MTWRDNYIEGDKLIKQTHFVTKCLNPVVLHIGVIMKDIVEGLVVGATGQKVMH